MHGLMKVILRLSEPWEMGEEMAWPAIPATVIHRDAGAWLVEVDQPFDYNGAQYQYLVISPRHVDGLLAQCTSMSVSCGMVKTTT